MHFNCLKQCVGAGLDVHIRHLGVLELRFRSYSEEPFSNAKKVPPKGLPLHADPRLGSDFPRSGVAPGGAARGRPWPRAAYSASLPRYPPTQRLCSASWKRGLAVIRQSIHPKSQRQIKISIGAAGTRSLVREGGLSDTSPITTHKSQPGLLRDLPRSLHILAADMPANGTEG